MKIVIGVASSSCYEDNILKECILDHISKYVFTGDSMYDISLISKDLMTYLHRYVLNDNAVTYSDMRAMISIIVRSCLKHVTCQRFKLVGVSKNNNTLVFRVTDQR